MPDDPDPPRKIYGFKAREDFERKNETTHRLGEQPSDVQNHLNSAASDPRATKVNAPGNRPTEVHALLQHNLKHDHAAGHYRVSLTPDPRRIRRVRNFWIALLVVDVPLAAFAWKIGHSSPATAISFVCALSGIAMFTSVLVWRTWFLRTE